MQKESEMEVSVNTELNLALVKTLWPERLLHLSKNGHGWFWLNPETGLYDPIPDLFSWAGMELVLERMRELGWWCQMRTPFGGVELGDVGEADSGPQGWYCAGFTPLLTTGFNGRPDHQAHAPTLPEAVFLAACKALGVEVNKDEA